MEKLTVTQYARKFNITTPGVYKRIKKGKLQVEIIKGVQHVLVDSDSIHNGNKESEKEYGGGEFNSFLKSENEHLKNELKAKEEKLEQKERELREKNDKIESIYQQVITVQNKNMTLQDENRLLIEQKSTHPISTGYNDGVIVEQTPSSEEIRKQKQNDKKKKDKKKTKGEGKRSKFKKKVK
jgi:hypothetical protein